MEHNDITEYFISLLHEYGSIDIADDAFKKRLHEDPVLKAEYREWCHEVGSSEKRGFLDFCDEYVDSQHSSFDSLSDYDDDF